MDVTSEELEESQEELVEETEEDLSERSAGIVPVIRLSLLSFVLASTASVYLVL